MKGWRILIQEKTKYCDMCREEHPYSLFEGKQLSTCRIWKWAERSVNEAFRRMQRKNRKKKDIGEEPLSFSITPSDLLELWKIQEGKCRYSNFDFFPPWLDGYSDIAGLHTPSIDRKNNDKGYERNNIVLASQYINLKKGDLSMEEYLAECEDSAYINIQVILKIKSEILDETFNIEKFLLTREHLLELELKKDLLHDYETYL